MRYTVTKQRVYILGEIWWPMGEVCATERDLSAYDMGNLGNAKDRSAVAEWIDKQVGDFSRIIDFRADFHIGNTENGQLEHIVHEWAKGEESEMAFCDRMYPAGD